MYENFFSCFDSFKTFNSVFDQVTKDYGCMVLDRTSSSNSVEDSIRWYRAPSYVCSDFKLGDDFYFEENQEQA